MFLTPRRATMTGIVAADVSVTHSMDRVPSEGWKRYVTGYGGVKPILKKWEGAGMAPESVLADLYGYCDASWRKRYKKSIRSDRRRAMNLRRDVLKLLRMASANPVIQTATLLAQFGECAPPPVNRLRESLGSFADYLNELSILLGERTSRRAEPEGEGGGQDVARLAILSIRLKKAVGKTQYRELALLLTAAYSHLLGRERDVTAGSVEKIVGRAIKKNHQVIHFLETAHS
jgi:hypothetical protein